MVVGMPGPSLLLRFFERGVNCFLGDFGDFGDFGCWRLIHSLSLMVLMFFEGLV